MNPKTRIYDTLLAEHLASHRQMAFISGPRQVGKTTTCRVHGDTYIDWDNIDDRESILAGPSRLIDHYSLDRLSSTPPVIIFDELHKFPKWKRFLKGFFDTYADRLRIIVTGSSRMDVYRRGGDSLISVASISKLLDGCSGLQQKIGEICRLMSTNRSLLPSAPSIKKLFDGILVRVCPAD